jgi:multidrug resistance efflux pump
MQQLEQLIKSLKAQLSSAQSQLSRSGGSGSSADSVSANSSEKSGDPARSTVDQTQARGQAIKTQSLQSQVSSLNSAIETATAELAQLMLASGQTTGMISTQA